VGANFEDADLSGADLRGASLQHAKFARANTDIASNSQLQGTVGLGEARFDSEYVHLQGATHSFEHINARPADGTLL